MRIIGFGLIVLAMLVCSSVSYGVVDSTDLLIGRDRQFFFDTIVIESIRNLTRKTHYPEKLPKPLIKKDKPWEHITYFTAGGWNVILDPQDNIFKCWYEDWYFDQSSYAKGGGMVSNKHFTRHLFAKSKDGIHWQKPEQKESQLF